MTATVHSLPSIPAAPCERRGTRAAARALGAALGACLLVAGVVFAAGSDARALRSLPPDARLALRARTLENLQSICAGDAKFAVPDFCQDQARLALALPECDEACVQAARAAMRMPTR